ncbi:MAG: response regulator, partial [Actinobacteria bacterium]|nr:response regulator [Actinomycetota bacterium]
MPGRGRHLLVVEDEPLMASLLQGSLTSAGFVVQTAADVESGRRAVDTFDPDIVLLDISLGDGPTGVHLAHALRKTRPGVAVLILTKHPDARSASKDGLELPPNVGFLQKHLVNDVTYLLDAIEKVLSDQTQDVRQDQAPEKPGLGLDSKAMIVLELLAYGYNNTEIALRCDLSTKSVERWIDRIYRDLGINTKGDKNPRVEAARRYYL